MQRLILIGGLIVVILVGGVAAWWLTQRDSASPELALYGNVDLRSMPDVVRMMTYVLPARYYVALLQTIFLAGDIWAVILPNAAVLAGMATVLVILTRRVTQKRLA